MANYTKDQFLNAVNSSGLYFSDADLNLGSANPDAGMEILNAKRNYMNATDAATKAAANARANEIRSTFGSFTAGTNGSDSSFKMTSTSTWSPIGYNPGEAPTYSGVMDSDMMDLYNQAKNYGDFSYGPAPKYTNRYDDKINAALDTILNNPEFSYDAASDDLYSQYRKAYLREGDLATRNALAQSAAATGGIPSSYANAAAAQAGNYYAAQLTDKIPELYQIAYNQYVQNFNNNLNKLSAVQGVEQADFNRYQVDLGQYNTDRAFDYGVYADKYNRLLSNLDAAAGLDNIYYNRYLTDLGQYNTDRDFGYNQRLDTIAYEQDKADRAWDQAWQRAQVGDYSGLRALGVDTSLVDGTYAVSGSGSGGSGGSGGRGYTYSGDDESGTPVGDGTGSKVGYKVGSTMGTGLLWNGKTYKNIQDLNNDVYAAYAQNNDQAGYEATMNSAIAAGKEAAKVAASMAGTKKKSK